MQDISLPITLLQSILLNEMWLFNNHDELTYWLFLRWDQRVDEVGALVHLEGWTVYPSQPAGRDQEYIDPATIQKHVQHNCKEKPSFNDPIFHKDLTIIMKFDLNSYRRPVIDWALRWCPLPLVVWWRFVHSLPGRGWSLIIILFWWKVLVRGWPTWLSGRGWPIDLPGRGRPVDLSLGRGSIGLSLPASISSAWPTVNSRKSINTSTLEKKGEQAYIPHAPLLPVLDNDTNNQWQGMHWIHKIIW